MKEEHGKVKNWVQHVVIKHWGLGVYSNFCSLAHLDMSKASCGWIGFAIRSVLTMDLQSIRAEPTI